MGGRRRQGRGQARPLERLSPLDLSNLRVAEHGLPMHVAALIVLDSRAPASAAALLDLPALRDTVRQRLPLVPRLRQRLYQPRPGLGPPVWADDPGFDIRRHVRSRSVPAPGDEAALLGVCTELNGQPLDRGRPLWQLWLLTGLADGRAALLIRLHHVVADGLAGLAMLAALLDTDPGIRPTAGPPFAPQRTPSTSELAADQVRRQVAAMARTISRLREPSAAATRVRALTRQMRQLARDGTAPRVSINVPVSGQHCILLVRADLERARAAAHAHGGTVNDAVLAAIAGGARALLGARGELRRGLVLKASVAVSVRGRSDPRAPGNQVGVMIVPLPVGEADPGRRLAEIARATAERKHQPPYQPNARVLQRWMVAAMRRQRLVNVLVSNLPGPAVPVSLSGARVLEMFQIGVVQGNVPVSVGVLSYAGQLNLAIAGDPVAVPDLAVFARGTSDALSQLDALAVRTFGPVPPSPRGSG